MTKKQAYQERQTLTNMSCSSERSVRELYDFADNIRKINSYLERASEGKIITQQNAFENMFLAESENNLRIWINHPKKTTMKQTFNEYKTDMINDLNRCLSFGDNNNLWEEEL